MPRLRVITAVVLLGAAETIAETAALLDATAEAVADLGMRTAGQPVEPVDAMYHDGALDAQRI
jgi:hypothetical protein